jgi:hypothetical protein
MNKATQIGEAVNAWEELRPTQRSSLSERREQPNARILEIMGNLGLRYPPASSIDRDAHAARVALLAEDCADLDPQWLDIAAREWAKNEPFMPRACELRERALRYGRSLSAGRLLSAPLPPEKPKLVSPPLAEDEVRKLPNHLIEMGVSVGEITPELATRIREERES